MFQCGCEVSQTTKLQALGDEAKPRCRNIICPKRAHKRKDLAKNASGINPLLGRFKSGKPPMPKVLNAKHLMTAKNPEIQRLHKALQSV